MECLRGIKLISSVISFVEDKIHLNQNLTNKPPPKKQYSKFKIATGHAFLRLHDITN
jgi:hypothetical protein